MKNRSPGADLALSNKRLMLGMVSGDAAMQQLGSSLPLAPAPCPVAIAAYLLPGAIPSSLPTQQKTPPAET